ncbi:MAG: hypothetical protein P1S59_02095 [bacterium]|nr:hypothetical protein [bacterium]
MSDRHRFSNSLNIRIILPVVLLVLFMWLGFNMSVFKTVEQFQTDRIEEDIKWASRFTYSIINENLYNLIRSESRSNTRYLGRRTASCWTAACLWSS